MDSDVLAPKLAGHVILLRIEHRAGAERGTGLRYGLSLQLLRKPEVGTNHPTAARDAANGDAMKTHLLIGLPLLAGYLLSLMITAVSHPLCRVCGQPMKRVKGDWLCSLCV